jgi:NADH-quinone oxidoreductase subunit L
VVGLIGFLAADGGAAAEGAAEHGEAVFNWFVQNAWLIPLLPFASAVLILAFGKRTPGKGTAFGIAAVFVAFVLAMGVLWNWVDGGSGEYERNIAWFDIGSLHLELGILVDGLTAVMLVVVTSVSLMVHVYSLGYMKGDVRYTWFYFVLSMFTAAMLVVVVSSNVIQLLIGWEIMGVCSYLLIGHWYEQRENSNAAIKAFITTRIGDVPMMFGFFALIAATGFVTTNINETTEAIAHGDVSTAFVAAAALLLFGGTIGKSAQFPLHVWLPDAMAGPTPVSALIHAATMVAAGVYLVGRLFEVFVVADPFVLTTVSIVAAITMLGAAILAIAQDDIKRVLAYSTLSQLAYMVAGLSMGPEGYTAGFFHLWTHAFFKALLFLGAGSVIHAVHSNNMSDMGGLRKKMPITFWTMIIGSFALAGIFPFSGFWSKDELLVVAQDTQTMWLLVTFLVTAAITAFYTTRMVLLAFGGEYRGHAHPHESPRSMAWPLLILAVPALAAGWLFQVFGQWVYFEHPHEAVVHWDIIVISTVVAWAGIAAGWFTYRRSPAVDPMQRRLGGVWGVLQQRYYVDAFYMRWIVRPIRDTWSAAVYWFNQNILDGIVNGAAALARGLSHVVMWFDRTVIDGLVNGAANVTNEGGGILRYLQSGNVQWYAVGVIAGVIVLTAFFIRLT